MWTWGPSFDSINICSVLKVFPDQLPFSRLLETADLEPTSTSGRVFTVQDWCPTTRTSTVILIIVLYLSVSYPIGCQDPPCLNGFYRLVSLGTIGQAKFLQRIRIRLGSAIRAVFSDHGERRHASREMERSMGARSCGKTRQSEIGETYNVRSFHYWAFVQVNYLLNL